MGKTRNAIDSDEHNSSYEDADVETEETDEGEEPSEGDPCEDGPVEENSSEEEQDEADPCEEEPSEEEPDKDSLHAPKSENLCEEELNVLLCEEESKEETSFEEELNKDSSVEGSREEECCGEPNEEPCEDSSQEEHCESEPSEDPEPNEEPYEEDPYEEDPSEGRCEEEPSESEVPSEDDGETIKSNSQQNSMSANAMSVPKGKTGSLDINLLGTSHNMLNTEKVDITRDRSKKRRSRWDIEVVSNVAADGNDDVAKEKRMTRWSSDNCQLKETSHLKIPDIAVSLEIAKLQAQLFQITNKLQARELVEDRPGDKRSPSPPPVYNNLGIKINSREARLRPKLRLQRQKIISELIQKNPNYKPPPDYCKGPRFHTTPEFSKKYYIPGYKIVRHIIGHRGNIRKRIENETGAKIYLRGMAPMQDGEYPGKKYRPYNDDLHISVEADNQFSLDSAVVLVEKILTSVTCDVCCGVSHSTSSCPLTASVPGADINQHEIKFFAEMGGESSSSSAAPLPNPYPPSVIDKGSHKSNKKSTDKGSHKSNKESTDDAYLFVGHLPQTVDEKRLAELFLPFGQLCESRVVRDKKARSKGFGFVKYTDRVDAAKAVMHMNGYTIDGKALTVQIAGDSAPSHVNTNAGSGGFLSPNQLPQYPGYASTAHNNPDPMCWLDPPGSVLSRPRPDNLFVKNSNSLPQNPFSGQHSLSSGPFYQPPRPSTLLSGDVVASDSDELAHFPGYLKSFDPPSQLHQPSPFYFTPDTRHP